MWLASGLLHPATLCILSASIFALGVVIMSRESQLFKIIPGSPAEVFIGPGYTMGVSSDSNGHGWGDAKHFLQAAGCPDHAALGKCVEVLCLAGVVMSAISFITHALFTATLAGKRIASGEKPSGVKELSTPDGDPSAPDDAVEGSTNTSRLRRVLLGLQVALHAVTTLCYTSAVVVLACMQSQAFPCSTDSLPLFTQAAPQPQGGLIAQGGAAQPDMPTSADAPQPPVRGSSPTHDVRLSDAFRMCRARAGLLLLVAALSIICVVLTVLRACRRCSGGGGFNATSLCARALGLGGRRRPQKAGGPALGSHRQREGQAGSGEGAKAAASSDVVRVAELIAGLHGCSPAPLPPARRGARRSGGVGLAPLWPYRCECPAPHCGGGGVVDVPVLPPAQAAGTASFCLASLPHHVVSPVTSDAPRWGAVVGGGGGGGGGSDCGRMGRAYYGGGAVAGYIETLPSASDVSTICNDDVEEVAVDNKSQPLSP